MYMLHAAVDLCDYNLLVRLSREAGSSGLHWGSPPLHLPPGKHHLSNTPDVRWEPAEASVKNIAEV